MKKRISRRQLLKAVWALTASVGLTKVLESLPGRAKAQDYDQITYLPIILKEANGDNAPEPPSTEGKVVHVHSQDATSWIDQTDYWNYVNQEAVNDMVDQGVMALTGTGAVADAWRALVPTYQAGQGIAIKVNLNHSTFCNDASGKIDALIHPINAVVRGLLRIGVTQADIWVYDAIRPMPDRFVNRSEYSGVRFFDDKCRSPAGFESNKPDSYVTFFPPSGIPMPPLTKITDVLINATYLINMPLLKIHSGAGVTFGFKNHFGTIDNPSGLHDYIIPGTYSNYSPLVDLYRSPHIAGKTILTIGDGLIASKIWSWPSPGWVTFGNQVPNSLFFATDPVAIDCVMCDFLAAETSIKPESDNYLRLAGDAGLGVFERGDPWSSGGYTEIKYQKIEL